MCSEEGKYITASYTTPIVKNVPDFLKHAFPLVRNIWAKSLGKEVKETCPVYGGYADDCEEPCCEYISCSKFVN